MRLRPSRPGLLVGYPRRATPLAQGGEEVTRSSYWLRRLMKGDVVEVLEDESAEPTTPEPTEPEPITPESTGSEPPTPESARRPRRKKAPRRAT